MDQNQAIANERENFRNLFRQTPEMVCILEGPDHRFGFVNDAHIKALGFDATGQTVRQSQPESVEVHGILDEVYRTGITAELHEIPITLTDRVRYFNLTYSSKRDLQGQIDGVMILGAEVTDQVLVREALKSQNQALESMLAGESLETVLNILARAMEHLFQEDAKVSILLLEPESTYLHHGAAPSLPSEYNQLIDGLEIGPQVGSCGSAAYLGQMVVVEDIASDPLWNGFHDLAARYGLRSCISSPMHSSRGALIGTFAVYNRPRRETTPFEKQVIDLLIHTASLVIERHFEASVRDKTELALQKSEKLFQETREQLGQAVDVAKIGFYDWDIPNDRLAFSEQMQRDWGVVGRPLWKLDDAVQLIHIDDRERVGFLIRETMEKDLPYETEYRVVKPGGETIWVEVRGHVHRDEQNQPIRFFGTSWVVTEQKAKEEAIRQAQASAEQANAAKGIFLANMSHEIRTPLGAIMGFLELLKNPANSRKELDDYIGVIDRNSQQLLRIVDDVLDLSKIEAGKLQIEAVHFSLVELLKDFTSLMAPKVREKGLRYEMRFQSWIPDVVEGDPTRLRQILSNIVGNAIKFTEKGHVITHVQFAGDTLTISVEDTGCGIQPEAAGRLFQPFSQADNSTTRFYGGTGLGLALTLKLCEALGGDFRLQKSVPGKGSIFVARVRLKVLSETKMTSAEDLHEEKIFCSSKRNESQILAGMRVLVVDDAPDNQALIQIFLKRWGAEVSSAVNGKEGVEKALNENFDVVLMDIQMPVMDGHEATRRLRQAGFQRPIVAVTAHAMREERTRCMESGFTDFLPKPIQRDGLRDLLLSLKSFSADETREIPALS